MAEIRSRKIGFVFQQFNLLARTSATENVELPLLYTDAPASERRARALQALPAVGLAGSRGPPAEPAVRWTAAARRHRRDRSSTIPRIILADEPTGALDSRIGLEIMAIFQRLNREHGITLIVVTHDPEIAGYAQPHAAFQRWTTAEGRAGRTSRTR